MIKFKIKFGGNNAAGKARKVTVKGFGIQPLQMLRIGQFALTTVKARVARGVGLDDAQMPPLKQYRQITRKDGSTQAIGPDLGYPGLKRKKGAKPIRDMKFTGAMLDNLSVRSATASQVRISFTTKLARQKALANQQRTPWLGFADSDVEPIQDYAKKVLGPDINTYFKQLKRSFGGK